MFDFCTAVRMSWPKWLMQDDKMGKIRVALRRGVTGRKQRDQKGEKRDKKKEGLARPSELAHVRGASRCLLPPTRSTDDMDMHTTRS